MTAAVIYLITARDRRRTVCESTLVAHDKYLDYLRLRGFSAQTIRRRASTLRAFSAYIAPKATEDADHDDIEGFLAGYTQPRTRHAYRSDIRAMYAWAVRRGVIAVDPSINVDPIKVPKALPRPLNPNLIPALIATAPDEDTRLMIALGAYAGLRRSEIAALCGDDVSTGGGFLIVRGGKGNKDRRIPLHPMLSVMLEGRHGGRLFHCHPNTVYKRIVEHFARFGIVGTPHQLRHTFGTELARACDGDLQMVGLLMGHEQLSSTQGYCAYADRGASAAVGGMYG